MIRRLAEDLLRVCVVLVAGSFAATASGQDPTAEQFRERVLETLSGFGDLSDIAAVRDRVDAATTFAAVDEALRPLALATIHVNPEARVKFASAAQRIDLEAGSPRKLLLRVENVAGISAPLRLRGVDLARSPPAPAEWFALRVVGSDETPTTDSAPLAGTTDEVFVVELLVDEPGTREVRLIADAGQGTQDLGFRATADVLLRVRSSQESDSR